MPQIPIYAVYNAWEAINDYCEEFEHLHENSLLPLARYNMQMFNWCQRDVDFGRMVEEFPSDKKKYDKKRLDYILKQIKKICAYCQGYHNEICYVSNARKAVEIALFGRYYPLKMNTFGEFLIRENVITSDNIQEAYIIQKRTNPYAGHFCIAMNKLTPLEVVEILKAQKYEPSMFGDIAVERGLLTKDDVDHILDFQKKRYLYIGDVLVALGYLTEEQKGYYLKRFKDEKDHKS